MTLKTTIRAIAGVIASLMVITLMLSCGNTGEGDTPAQKASVPGSSSLLEATTDDTGPKPSETEYDMGGRTVTILTSGWGKQVIVDIDPADQTGEPINDAAFNRALKLEQNLNCKIAQVDEIQAADAAKRLQTSVMAQDGAFDIALIMGANFQGMITGGYLSELDKIKDFEPSMPWWNQSSYKALAVGNKHLGIVGDFTVHPMNCVWIVCFNKIMLNDFKMDSPYDLVKSGDWTFDKAVELAKVAAKDVNGDTQMDQNDQWGINYTGDTIMGMINCFGVNIAELDSAGTPILTVNQEKSVSRIQHLYENLFNEAYSVDTLFRYWLPDTEIFADNRCLFLFTATHQVNELRNMSVDFGIVPYPKYNKEQPEYISSTAGIFLPILCVPKSDRDSDGLGIFLNNFAYEGYKNIIPQYYETLLKTKVARDNESVEMIDFIFSNVHYDNGNIFNYGEINGLLGYTLSSKNNKNVVSALEKNQNIMQAAINKMMDEITK